MMARLQEVPWNDKPDVIVITDGSANAQDRSGGWAAIIAFNRDDGMLVEMSGASSNTTVNEMELDAFRRALDILPRYVHISWIADSKFALNAVAGRDLETGGPFNVQAPGVRALALEIRQLLIEGGHKIQYAWVKGHQSVDSSFSDEFKREMIIWNTRCDRLAGEARRRGIALRQAHIAG